MTAAPAPIAMPVPNAPRRTVRMHSSEIGPIAAATTNPRPKPSATTCMARILASGRRGPRRAEPFGRLQRPDAGPPFARAPARRAGRGDRHPRRQPRPRRDGARRQPLQRRASWQLKCPDLRMKPPGDLRVRKAGKVLRLLATNHIVNVGAGALELRAEHSGRATRDGYRFASRLPRSSATG